MKIKRHTLLLIAILICLAAVGIFAFNAAQPESFTAEMTSSSAKTAASEINHTNLGGYYIGVKGKKVDQVNDPIIIAYINPQKNEQDEYCDYFSIKELADDVEIQPELIDELAANEELIDKTFSTLRRLGDNYFTATMNHQKNGIKLQHDLLLYVPVSKRQQIYLAIDNDDGTTDDYLLVKTTAKKLTALSQKNTTDLREGLLRNDFGLYDLINTRKAAFSAGSHYLGQKGFPVLN